MPGIGVTTWTSTPITVSISFKAGHNGMIVPSLPAHRQHLQRAGDPALLIRHLHLIPRWTRDGKGFDWKLVPGDRTQIMAIGQKIRDAVEARR